jgi:hypothetical protein
VTTLLDPTRDPEAQGYTPQSAGTDGVQSGVQSDRVFVRDDSTANYLIFWKAFDALASGAVRIEVPIRVLTTSDGDNGAGVVLAGGSAGDREVVVTCTAEGGQRRLRLRREGGLSAGIPFDWSSERTFVFGRTDAGAAFVEADGARDEVAASELPASRTRPGATFEIGCASEPAVATAFFGEIRLLDVAEDPVTPEPEALGLSATQVHLQPGGSDRILVHLDVTGGAGVDAGTEPVTFRLHKGGAEFYPGPRWDNPLTGFDDDGSRWARSSAIRSATGIEAFNIGKPDANGNLSVEFVDTRADLADEDYGEVRIELGIGGRTGETTVNLTRQPGNVWRP